MSREDPGGDAGNALLWIAAAILIWGFILYSWNK